MISIFDEIQHFKQTQGTYLITKKGKKESNDAKIISFDKESEKEKIKGIIQNNIYGVDLNPESVEITKLSLFLKIASKNKRLIGLENRIRTGNSLIEDKTVHDRAFDWNAEFTEVMKFGKFDIIVGNPPYLKIEYLGEKARKYFQENYKKSYMKRFDAYGLFMDRSITLLKNKGLFGMIVPSTMLNNLTFTNLRKLILDTTSIKQIVNLGGKIFQNVTNDTLIIILKNSWESSFNTEVFDVSKYGGGLDSIKKLNDIDFHITSNPPDYSFELRITKKDNEILNKMKENSIRFDEICSTFQGFVTGNNDAFLVTENEINLEKLEKTICKHSVFGKEIKRYQPPQPNSSVIYLTREKKISDFPQIKKRLQPFKSVLEKKREVRLGRQPWYSLHWPREQSNFERKEKLLVQAIRNLALNRRVIATLDDNKLYADHTLFVPILENPDYDIRYILGILNSNVINYMFQKKYVDINIKSVYIDAIPVPEINIDKQQTIIEKVDQILLHNKNNLELNKKLQDRMTQNLELEKFSNKLKNFHELNFNEFLKELKKEKIELTLKKQEEWNEYFDNKKQEKLKNITQIEQLDSDLDKLIYKLYGLSEDDIYWIEQSSKNYNK